MQLSAKSQQNLSNTLALVHISLTLNVTSLTCDDTTARNICHGSNQENTSKQCMLVSCEHPGAYEQRETVMCHSCAEIWLKTCVTLPCHGCSAATKQPLTCVTPVLVLLLLVLQSRALTASRVTFLAAPKVRPPTLAATWVPCPPQSWPTSPVDRLVKTSLALDPGRPSAYLNSSWLVLIPCIHITNTRICYIRQDVCLSRQACIVCVVLCQQAQHASSLT